jgi:hypothetical protein
VQDRVEKQRIQGKGNRMAKKSKKKESGQNPRHLTVAIYAQDLAAAAKLFVLSRWTMAAGRTLFPIRRVITIRPRC